MPAIVASRQSKLCPPSENLTNKALFDLKTFRAMLGSRRIEYLCQLSFIEIYIPGEEMAFHAK